MTAILPVALPEEARLLTGVLIGGLFGFALERGGFGNARKLAAQFYLHDMTVFKVMFTAIITAMAGLFTLSQLGYVDLAAIWINPTFMWSQVIGGFMLGVGFIISGLCPGTSVVSAASGRIDGWVTLAGIFVGTFLFAAVIDVVPGMAWLHSAGSMGVSLLPDVLHVPAPLLVLAVVLIATGGFVGAEIVERMVATRHPERNVELTPHGIPRMKFAVAGAIAFVALSGAGALRVPRATPAPLTMASIDPLSLARRIIAHDPNLVILDLRNAQEKTVPGAIAARPDTSAVALFSDALPQKTVVVVYDQDGSTRAVPEGWPRDLTYRYVQGGFAGWQQTVLTPAPAASTDAQALERVRTQNQMAAYFSGATVKAGPVAAPPPVAGGGGVKKKKAGGC